MKLLLTNLYLCSDAKGESQGSHDSHLVTSVHSAKSGSSLVCTPQVKLLA